MLALRFLCIGLLTGVTVGFVTIGVSEFVDSIQRPLVTGERLLVCRRGDKLVSLLLVLIQYAVLNLYSQESEKYGVV